MKGVPAEARRSPVSITVRGEIILKLSDMKKAFPGAAQPAQPGGGHRKRFDGAGLRAPHRAVLRPRRRARSPTEVKKFERLAALGLHRAELPRRPTSTARSRCTQEYAKTKRAKLDYEIDGLVVRANDVHAQHMLGELGNRPRAAVALQVRVAGEGHARSSTSCGRPGRRAASRRSRSSSRSSSPARRCSARRSHNAANVDRARHRHRRRGAGLAPQRRHPVRRGGRRPSTAQRREAADEVRDVQRRSSRSSASTSSAATASAARSSRAASRTGSARWASSSGARS